VLDDPASRYPGFDSGTLAALGPELVLLPSEPYEFAAADATEVAATSPCCTLLRPLPSSRAIEPLDEVEDFCDGHHSGEFYP
jgi:hypothetical protein